MVKYGVNPKNGRLHRYGCRHMDKTFIIGENLELGEILSGVHGRVMCCKVCLKDDEEVLKLVEEHNLKWKQRR